MSQDDPLVVLQLALCDSIPADMLSILAGPRGDSSGSSRGGSCGRSGSSSGDSGGDSSGSSGTSGADGGHHGGESPAPAVACFYSIQSTQPGLSGLDLGRVTIFKAAHALLQEAKAAGGQGWPLQFVTLSPMPGFRAWLEARLAAAAAAGEDGQGGAGGAPGTRLLTAKECDALLASRGGSWGDGGSSSNCVVRDWSGGGHGSAGAVYSLNNKSSCFSPPAAGLASQKLQASEQERHAAASCELQRQLSAWLQQPASQQAPAVRRLLLRLAATYLVQTKGRGGVGVVDPVGNFHLSNGASLWRINFRCLGLCTSTM